MKTILSLWCLCVFLPALVAKEKMHFTAYYQTFLPPSGQTSPYPVAVHHFDVWLNIKNEGTENLIVPTAGYLTRQSVDGKSLKLIVLFEVSHSITGETVRRADSNYELVVLKPGEMTEIKFATGYMESPVAEINVAYKVEDGLAKMHGIWSGQLEAKATDVMALYMPSSSEAGKNVLKDPSGTSRASKADTSPASSSSR